MDDGWSGRCHNPRRRKQVRPAAAAVEPASPHLSCPGVNRGKSATSTRYSWRTRARQGIIIQLRSPFRVVRFFHRYTFDQNQQIFLLTTNSSPQSSHSLYGRHGCNALTQNRSDSILTANGREPHTSVLIITEIIQVFFPGLSSEPSRSFAVARDARFRRDD